MYVYAPIIHYRRKRKLLYRSWTILTALLLVVTFSSSARLARAEEINEEEPSGMEQNDSETPTDESPSLTTENTESQNAQVGNSTVSVALSATCKGTPDIVKSGETALLRADPKGATGNYTYNWSGTEALSGLTQTISKQYYSPGAKRADVTVTSGGYTVTASCAVTVMPLPDCPNCYGESYEQPIVLVLEETGPSESTFSDVNTVEVELSQTPETGFDDSSKLFLFGMAILMFAGILAELAIFYPLQIKENIVKYTQFSDRRKRFSRNGTFGQTQTKLPQSGKLWHPGYVGNSNPLLDVLEFQAYAEKAIISDSGLSLIAHIADNDPARSVAIIKTLANFCRLKYPHEDGWTALNRHKILLSLTSSAGGDYPPPDY